MWILETLGCKRRQKRQEAAVEPFAQHALPAHQVPNLPPSPPSEDEHVDLSDAYESPQTPEEAPQSPQTPEETPETPQEDIINTYITNILNVLSPNLNNNLIRKINLYDLKDKTVNVYIDEDTIIKVNYDTVINYAKLYLETNKYTKWNVIENKHYITFVNTAYKKSSKTIFKKTKLTVKAPGSHKEYNELISK
jgi:hypothetical protein